MPIQMWTPMAQPDTSSVANAIAGAGRDLGAGLAGIADRMEKRKEEDKQRRQRGKAAESFFKASPDLQKHIGMTPDAFGSLSDDDKQAAVAGGINAISLARANEEALRKQKEYERQASSAEALQAAAAAAARGNLERYYEFPEQFPQGAPTFDQALFNNPAAVNAPNFNEFARATQPQQVEQTFFDKSQVGRGIPILTPDGTPIPGTYTTPIGPRAGQLITDPTTPQRPSAEKPTDEGSIEVPDADDPVYGPRIRITIKTAREKYPHLLKRLEPPAGTQPAPASGPASAPAAGGPPSISTRAQYDALKSGDLYIGKDGIKYRKP